MMNYRRLAARAGLPAWMLLAPLALAQDTPSEEEPTQPEKTEEPVPAEKTTVEGDTPAPKEETTPPNTSLPAPKLPTPVAPTEKPGDDPATDLPEVEESLDGIPVIPGAPLPEGDPLLQGTGDTSILPLIGPEAPTPEDAGLLADDAATFGQGTGQDGITGSTLDEQTSLMGRNSDTKGLVFSIGVTENYSSNLELDESDPLSVFYTTFSPGFSYRSAAEGDAQNIFAFNYDAGFDFYHDGAVDDATNHNLASIITHKGDKLTVEHTLEFNQSTDSSRFTESLSENTAISTNLRLNYKLTDKTALSANADFRRTESSAGSADANDLFGASISGLYIYSPKLSFGPSIRYAQSESDTNGDISSFAFGADIRYKPTSKIQIQSTLGVESVDPEDESSETSPTATLGIIYRPSPIWSFNGEIRYEAIPINSRTDNSIGLAPGDDPLDQLNGPSSDGDQQINASLGIRYSPGDDWSVSGTFNHRTSPSFINPGESIVDTSFGLGITRNFNRSQLSFRYTCSTTEFEGSITTPLPGPPAPSRGDQTYQQFSLYYSYPELFRGFDLDAGISYLDNSGSAEYDATNISVSVNYRF